MATSNQPKHRSGVGESYAFFAIVFAILLVLNYLATQFSFGRIDLTENRAYSLSKGSKDAVSKLDEKLEIVGYFTKNLPPPHNAAERYVRDLLAEYEAASNGRLKVLFIDPEDDEEEEEAKNAGVIPVQHATFDENAQGVAMGYRGLVFRYLTESKTIPVVGDQSGALDGLEYEITTTLKELTGEKRNIGVLGGVEGASISTDLKGIASHLRLYNLVEVGLEDEIDDKLAALIIVHPKKEIPEATLKRIDAYLQRGGSLGVFGGGSTFEIGQRGPSAKTVSSGINKLIAHYGVKVREDMLADLRAQVIPTGRSLMTYPAVPEIIFDEEQRKHPALFKMGRNFIPFTSTIAIDDSDENVKRDILAASSENSWRMTGELNVTPRPVSEWTNANSELGPFAILTALEGKLPKAFDDTKIEGEQKPARIIVAGAASMMVSPFVQEANQRGAELSAALSLNLLDWLGNESDLVAIRNKVIEDPPIEIPANLMASQEDLIAAQQEAQEAVFAGDQTALDDAQKRAESAIEKGKLAQEEWKAKTSRYQWLNTLGIPFLFGFFGIMRWRSRNKKKQNIKL